MGRLPSHLIHQAANQPRKAGRAAFGLQVRGVVIAVYETDNPNRRMKLVQSGGIVCDVLVYEAENNTLFREVPIQVQSGGVSEHEIWRPKPASQKLGGGALVVSPEGRPIKATKAEDMDGDHVLISFIGNDLQKPIIVGQIPHPQNLRRASVNSAAFKYQRFIRGISMGVTMGGNIEIDASLASSGTTTPTGADVPSASAGNITITMGALRALSVLAVAGSTAESALKADTFLSDLNLAYAEVVSVLTALGFGGGLTQSAAFITKLTTSNTPAKLPYRSLHVVLD